MKTLYLAGSAIVAVTMAVGALTLPASLSAKERGTLQVAKASAKIMTPKTVARKMRAKQATPIHKFVKPGKLVTTGPSEGTTCYEETSPGKFKKVKCPDVIVVTTNHGD